MRRFLSVANPRQIILFGSHARGEACADSDVDLVVVDDGPFTADNSRRGKRAMLDRALRGLRVPVDILVFTPEEIEEWSGSTNYVISDVLREGRLLYDRPGSRSSDAQQSEIDLIALGAMKDASGVRELEGRPPQAVA